MRRRWPEKLIAWTRLMNGRFRDPMIGRDVFVGVLSGLAFVAAVVGSGRIISWYSATRPSPHFGRFAPLLDVRHAIGHVIGGVRSGFYEGFMFMTLLAVLTMIFRRRSFGAVAFAVVLSSVIGIAWGEVEALPVIVSTVVLVTFVATRFGLLSLMVVYAIFAILMFLPAVSGVDWAEPLIAIPFVSVALLALWAFVVSLGGNS